MANDTTKTSLPAEVITLLGSAIKPDNLSGFEMKNESLPTIRVKFGQEDKFERNKAHPDLLKVVAIIRLFHSTILQNMRPSQENASKIQKIVTYGLLTEKSSVRVIGIRAVPEHDNYIYQLFNVGVFSLEPKKPEYAILVSFLLEACRETIQQENKLIQDITKQSVGRQRMKSSQINSSKFNENDELVVSLYSTQETNVTLTRYLFERSTPHDKDIFQGRINHSGLPVIVKIFYDSLSMNPHYNIFLPIDCFWHNGSLRKEHLEISVEGDELSCIKKRLSIEKIHIMTQLLLEIESIHQQKRIHNDIKPSNIITIERPTDKQLHTKPTFLCKFIDFELEMRFSYEEGDFSKVTSTSGTPRYNEPEKRKDGDHFIHPKTDIYSLGLAFIEIILEKECNQRIWKDEKAIQELWSNFQIACMEQFNEKGKTIFNMVKNTKEVKD